MCISEEINNRYLNWNIYIFAFLIVFFQHQNYCELSEEINIHNISKSTLIILECL